MYYLKMLPQILSTIFCFHFLLSTTLLAHKADILALCADSLSLGADSRALGADSRAQGAANTEMDTPSNSNETSSEIFRALANQTQQDGTEDLDRLNQELESLRGQLQEVHRLARLTCQETPDREVLLQLVKRAATLRQQLLGKENAWRQTAKLQQPSLAGNGKEQSASWHFPEITLFQLIVEFGSQEHLYLIPPELSSQKVSVVAGFAIPRSSWPDLVEWILAQQGLAIRPLNAFCRQIYSVAKDSLQIDAITTKRVDLAPFCPQYKTLFGAQAPRANAVDFVGFKRICPSTRGAAQYFF